MLRLFRQFSFRPPIPTTDFSGNTVIVTGANVGLRREAMKPFVRRGAAKVIATVSSSRKGKAALTEIEAYTHRSGILLQLSVCQDLLC